MIVELGGLPMLDGKEGDVLSFYGTINCYSEGGSVHHYVELNEVDITEGTTLTFKEESDGIERN